MNIATNFIRYYLNYNADRTQENYEVTRLKRIFFRASLT